MVLSSTTAQTPTSETTAETPPRCGLADFDDVESRTVVASLVVDALVDVVRTAGKTSSGTDLYHARLTVIAVLKGRLERFSRRPGGLVTATVGTFARKTGTTSTTGVPDVEELCASFHLPANRSRYIVFLQRPTSTSDDVGAPSALSASAVYSISSSPEPFSATALDIVRRYSRRRYGMWYSVYIKWLPFCCIQLFIINDVIVT